MPQQTSAFEACSWVPILQADWEALFNLRHSYTILFLPPCPAIYPIAVFPVCSSSRRRGLAKKYFGGIGRDFVGFPNRAKETIDKAMSDMLGGLDNLLKMIPYDEIEGQ
ncbi:hypothetical protein ElyMa_003582700 [Elysia marginata]|uniref:Uncharacterized protein n=1 Tax=Elysia marginata TaxID=1093978 RepID=A0AAV4ENJ3_9GAST|nr:hypothetical protein ElyMa_003582700 [Elysia marginata]